MLKRNGKIRMLALVLAIIMALASVDIGAFAVESDNGIETVSDNLEATPGETLKEIDEKTPGDNLSDETDEETPGSTSKGAGETAAESGKTETSEETEPEDESKLSETTEETSEDNDGQENVIEETMNALFVISWYDEGNVAERRPEDIRRLIEIYADGELLDDTKLDITLLNEDQDGDGKPEPDRTYGLETYYYVISNLPVYAGAEDGREEQNKITYTIKEDRAAIPGYKEMNMALLDSDAGELQNKMAAPGDMMHLEAYEGEGRETRNRFVNYLPEYSVSGRVVWDVEDSSYPEIEAYFEDYFAVTAEDRDYVCHTITYSKDEEEENIWNFSITGLFTTNEDGSAASYVLHPAELEWFETAPVSVTVTQDMADVEFVYTLGNSEAAIMAVDIGDEGKKRTATYNAHPNTQIVWYDTTGGDKYQHYGQLTMKVTYTVSGAESGEAAVTRTIEPVWDSVEGGYYYRYTEEDAKALGVSVSDENDKDTWLWIWDNGDNNINRTLQAWELPDTVTTTTTGDDGEVSTVSQNISWSIEVTGCTATSFAYDDRVTGYSVYPNAAGSGSVMYPLQNFTLYMDIRAGYDDPSAWMDVFFKEMGLAFSCTGGDSTSLIYDSSCPEIFSSESLAAIFEEHFGVVHSKEENSFISMQLIDKRSSVITVHGIPIYDGNKREINYSIITTSKKITSENAEEDYWYVVEFDNTAVPGHGTDVSAAHNKGTIILTKTGITKYEAYKIWQDEEDENEDNIGEDRPKTTWTLWRGSENGGSYVTAAQVFYDAEGRTLEVTSYGYDKYGDKLNNTKDSYAIGDWLTRGYTIEEFLVENLPAYDSDGYTYVYFARESQVEDSTYVKYYGSKTENGYFSEEDRLPEDYEGNLGATERLPDDNPIYNGGAVANRKEEMTTISATKTWMAAYYQNKLENIEVELKLQAKHKREQNAYGDQIVSERNEWYDVEDESGAQVTLILSGFDAYNLTQTGSVEVNQYCDHGHELEYRWVEATIYEVTEEADGTKTRKAVEWFTTDAGEDAFRLSVNKETLKEESYEHSDEYFISETETEGNITTITNTLKGYTEYYVRKTWDEGLEPGPIQVTIEQYNSAGRQVKTWEETLSNRTSISGESTELAYDGDYSSMDSRWVHLSEKLPKYDENGNLYTYAVRETNSPYTAYYEYGLDVDNDGVKETNSVHIYNRGPGVVKTIDVRKVWLDDSATTDRAACSFAVYAGTYGGDNVLLRGTVQNEKGILSPDFVVVSEDTSWWKHVDVTVFSYLDENGKTVFLTDTENYRDIEEYTPDEEGRLIKSTKEYASEKEWQQAHLVEDFYITENKIGDTEVGTNGTSSQGYPITKSGGTSYVTIYNNTTDGDNYDCTDAADRRGHYTIINRRIGTLDYTITKKWNDGISTDEMRQAWEAALTISCDENENTVQEKYIDGDGKISEEETAISYGYTQRPVNSQYTEDDEEFQNAVGEILAKEQYGYAPIYNNTTQQVSSKQSLGYTKNSNTETVYYYNLPMYDVYGRLLHYSVKEEMNKSFIGNDGNEVDCEYGISYGDMTYIVKTGDSATESQTIVNTLMDTEEYEWHLLWLDAYRYTTGQRPDIYLTLYYTVYEYDEAGNLKLDEYGNPIYTVEPYPFTEYLWTETSDPENTENYWTASFELPKYDANGTRVTYYADISTSVNFAIIDYVESQYASGIVGNVERFTEVDADGNPTYNTSKVTYDPVTDSYVVNYETDSSIVNKATTSDGKTVYVLEAGNTFVNQIKENVNINGRKVWENVPEGFPVNELPILTFNLYRLKMNTKGEYLLADGQTITTYEESWSHEIIKGSDGRYVLQTSDGERHTHQYQIELASIIKDVKSDSIDYNFYMNHAGYNAIDGKSIPDQAALWAGLEAQGYSLVEEGYGSPMEKYDASGNMYKYTVVETVSEDMAANVDKAYESLYGSVNGYGITNTYNITTNIRQITLGKAWDAGELEEIKAYPETEYTLYRFYEYTSAEMLKNGNYSEPEAVDSKTLTAASAANGESVDFGNQLVYSPNGTPYIYFIVEEPVKGYVNNGFTLNSDGVAEPVQEQERKEGWPSQAAKSKWYPEMSTKDGWGSEAFTLTGKSNAASVGILQGIIQFFSQDDMPVTTVSTENKYTGLPRAEVSGTKVWKDYNNIFGTRLEEIYLDVWRWAAYDDSGETGSYQYVGYAALTASYDTDGSLQSLTGEWTNAEKTAEGYAPNVTGKITVEAEGDANGNWTYTLSGLDGYYTSSHKYYYEIYERRNNIAPYTVANKGYAKQLTNIEKTDEMTQQVYRDIKMAELTNSSTTSLTVTKEWGDLNTSLALPAVAMGLQVSPDEGNTWYWAEDYFEHYYPAFSYTAGYERTLKNGSWSATYKELPTGYKNADGNYQAFAYRAAEKSIGGVEVNYTMDKDNAGVPTVTNTGTFPNNIYRILLTSEGSQTTMTNQTDMTKLTVTKEWENDSGNAYRTRGDVDEDSATSWSVEFHVYRSYTVDGETKTELVCEPDGRTPYVLVISGTNSEDSKTVTLENLPAAAPDGSVYTYYAVELNPKTKEEVNTTTPIYNGTYNVESANSTIVGDMTTYQTKVTNSLDTTELSVTKTWDDNEQTTMRPEEIQLTLYRYTEDVADAEPVDYSDTAVLKPDDWKVTYEKLPKYNADGELYYYYVTEEQQTGYKPPKYLDENNDGTYSETITNMATELSLDKISTIPDGEGQPVKLNNVTLGFEMTDGDVTWKLTWSRDASGIEAYTLMKGETAWSSGRGKASNKRVTVTGLPEGIWELKSESTPNGYTMPESAAFTMGNDGTISGTSGSITASDDKLSIAVEDEPTRLTLVKKGKNSNGTLEAIPGGYTFRINGTFRKSDSEVQAGTRYIGTIPSGETELADGMLLVSDTSRKGQTGWKPEYLYELKEEKAPAGYKLSEYSVSFYLDETGNVAIYQIIDGEDNVISEAKWGDIAQTDNTNGATIEFIDEPFELTLLKTDNNTENPERLAGAEFSLEVYNSTDDTWSFVEINGKPVDGTDVGEKLTTDAKGTVTLQSQDYGLDVTCKYRITETKAPDGFSLPSTTKDGKTVPAYTVEFEFNKDGMLKTGGSTLTFTDAPISISIIKKDAEDKKALSNVDFELYIVDQNGQENKIAELTTDGDGRADIPAVKMAYGNTYRLYELANPGYIEQKTLVYAFTVNPDGTITPEGEFAGSSVADKKNADGTVAESVEISLENERILGTLTVTKVDDKNNDEKLEGAEFTLYKAVTDSDGKTVKGEKVGDTDYPNPAVTDNDGLAVFNDLEWGNYILEETKAPDGYERRTDTWNITIGRKGTDIVLTVPETIWNTKNRISFQKYADGGEISLSGAEFALMPYSDKDRFVTNDVSGLDEKYQAAAVTNEDGRPVIRWTSVKDSPLALEGYLIAGNTYVLTEAKAPDGYELNTTSYIFIVTEDGKIAAPEVIPEGYTALPVDSLDASAGVVYNTPIEITIQKQDAVDSDRVLSDAEFSMEVYDSASQQWIYVKDGPQELDGENGKLTTDGNGQIKLTASDGTSLVTSGETYRLIEVTTPEGYITRTPKLSLTFTVKTDGTPELAKDTDSAVSIGNSEDTILVSNTKTKLYIEKLDGETGSILSGAELAIYRASDFDMDEDGVWTVPKSSAEPVMTLTSGENEYAEELSEDETYVLYEAGTPSGYDSFAPVEFTLKTDNEVQLEDTSRTDVRLSGPDDEGNYRISVDDTRIRGHVTLTKTADIDGDGQGDEIVPGVVFALYRAGETRDEDTLIAENLVTDENGTWTSENNGEDMFTDTDGQKKPFAAGLPTGEYYFVETKATADTALNMEYHRLTIGDSDTEANGSLQTVTVVNKVFTAGVSLTKLDEVSGDGISGVMFELSYIPEGGTEDDLVKLIGITDAKGNLSFNDLTKGSYTLTEISADGYDISQTHAEKNLPFAAEFVINDDDDGKIFSINAAAAEDGVNPQIQVVQGDLTGDGITNARLLGSVTLYKMDGGHVDTALNDVEFTLYKQDETKGLWDELWTFLTGKTYSAIESFKGEELIEAGKLVIEDLDWGTYKLVETKAKDGYTTTDKNTGEAVETVAFVIDRNSSKVIELNTDGNSFYNYQTSLLIKKQSEDGSALEGAEFALKGMYVDESGKTVKGTLNLVTDSQGQIELKGVLISGENYVLTETAAPEGYEKLTASLQFKVLDDGTISVTENASGYKLIMSDFFDNQIVVINQKKVPVKETGGNGPKTGDEGHIAFGFVMMFLSGMCLAGVTAYGKKKKRSK